MNDQLAYEFALCIWKEARGEGTEGMRAVGHVIKNRIGAIGFPRDLHSVIYQPNAFTSMSVPNDPEYALIPLNEDTQFAFCKALVPAILSGTDPDLTNGACYYANLRDVTSGWFSRHISGPDGQGMPNHPLLATIGHQKFYR